MKNGPYELVVAPEDYPGKRYRGRYCYEHHLVWWQHTGSLPAPGFDVHHKNEQKRDNRFDNLEMLEKGVHTGHHNKERSLPAVTLVCANCGTKFILTGRLFNMRRKHSKRFFCSKSCGGMATAKHVITTR